MRKYSAPLLLLFIHHIAMAQTDILGGFTPKESSTQSTEEAASQKAIEQFMQKVKEKKETSRKTLVEEAKKSFIDQNSIPEPAEKIKPTGGGGFAPPTSGGGGFAQPTGGGGFAQPQPSPPPTGGFSQPSKSSNTGFGSEVKY